MRQALRDIVLAGGDDPALRSRFLASGAVEAVRLWVGEAALRSLNDDPGRAGVADLIERDIVELDDMIGEKLDWALHQPALQRLEGRLARACLAGRRNRTDAIGAHPRATGVLERDRRRYGQTRDERSWSLCRCGRRL